MRLGALVIITLCLCAQGMSKQKKMFQFQKIQNTISGELIALRKQDESLQDRVYQLLDHLAQMGALAKEMNKQKKNYKQAYDELSQEHKNKISECLVLNEKIQKLEHDYAEIAHALDVEKIKSQVLEEKYQEAIKKLQPYEQASLEEELIKEKLVEQDS